MTTHLHETLYRGEDLLGRLAQARLVVCGAGALGSLLCDNLVRHGARNLLIIDRDRVEEHNLGTQVYNRADIGARKAEALAAHLFRAMGTEVEAVAKELAERNVAKLLRGADLVFDCFDNSASRRLVAEHCAAQGLDCLHLGVHTDYGAVEWNQGYRVPQDVLAPGACDYPLARNLLLVVIALGSEAALQFLADGSRNAYEFTLRDLTVSTRSETR